MWTRFSLAACAGMLFSGSVTAGTVLEGSPEETRPDSPLDQPAGCPIGMCIPNVSSLTTGLALLDTPLILCDGPAIEPEHLAIPASAPAAAASAGSGASGQSLDDYFRQFVLANQDAMTESDLARARHQPQDALGAPRQDEPAAQPRLRPNRSPLPAETPPEPCAGDHSDEFPSEIPDAHGPLRIKWTARS